jgi:hypothetical protein
MVLTLEEQPQSNLHDTRTGLAENSAKRWRIRLIIDLSQQRMVEEVQCLQTNVEVALLVLRKIKILQQGGIRRESPWSPHIRKGNGNIAKAEIGRPDKHILVKHGRGIWIGKGPLHDNGSIVVDAVVLAVVSINGPSDAGVVSSHRRVGT